MTGIDLRRERYERDVEIFNDDRALDKSELEYLVALISQRAGR